MVAFLEKSTGSEGFHESIDFLNRSHINYALARKPEIYISFIKQFWRTTEATTSTYGKVKITATIDGQSMTITVASLRRHLKLEDNNGIYSLPNSEIFEQLALMGYHTDSDKLTFQKDTFSPQWRFLIHNILHFNQCGLVYSQDDLRHMVSNIKSPHKFLMYPRFIQICLDMQKKQLQSHSKTYLVHSLNNKVFSNMKRLTKGYSGVEVALFLAMLNVPKPLFEPSPSRITSSPSQSSEPTPDHTITTTPSSFEPQPSPAAEEPVPTPHDSPLHDVHSHGSDEGRMKLNELTIWVKKLENKVKTGKARRRVRLVLSEDKDFADDSSKQGRKISDIDEDPNIFLAQDEGVEWVQDKASNETKLVLQEETPTEVVHDQGSSEKSQPEVSTADIPVNTAGVTTGIVSETTGTATEETPIVSTARVNFSTAGTIRNEIRSTVGRVVYSRLSFADAIRLQEQANKEELTQIARDEEIARQLTEQERQRAVSEAKSTRVIDWNDPSVQRYHALKNKPKTEAQARKNMITYLKNQGNYKVKDFQSMSYDKIRPIFEKLWDFNQAFLSKGSEEVQKEEVKAEKVEEDVKPEQIVKEVSKKSGGKRRKILARKRTKEAQDKDTLKRQKLDEEEADDQEEENITQYMVIVPVEEIAINAIPLASKPPMIVDVEIVSEEQMSSYYIIRADENSRRYSTMTLLFQDIDREDLENL
ncbi:hypothetical protein Tco_1504683 [Tanacetum coccineum]